MPIEEIEKKILAEAEAEAEKIKAEAENTVRQMEREHKSRLLALRHELAESTRQKAEAVKRAILVPARQKSKRDILETKRRILDQVYLDIQKQKNLPEDELKMIKENTEVLAGQILFEDS